MQAKTYTVKQIFSQGEKKQPMESLIKGELVAGEGLRGDCHFGESKKQLTLMGGPGKVWCEGEGKQSICGAKFEANFYFEESLSDLEIGDRLVFEEGCIEITGSGKKCYPEICKVHTPNKTCILQREIKFAKVMISGEISVGDKGKDVYK